MSYRADQSFVPRIVVNAQSISGDALECCLGHEAGARYLKKEELRWPEQAKLLNSALYLLQSEFALPRGALCIFISFRDIPQPSAMLKVAAGLSLHVCDSTVSDEVYLQLQSRARAFIESMQHHGETDAFAPNSLEGLPKQEAIQADVEIVVAAMPDVRLGIAEAQVAEISPDVTDMARACSAGVSPSLLL